MTNKIRPLLLDDRDTPSFSDWEKMAGTRLSSDARLWQPEIVAQISAAHPYLPAEDLTVEWNRLDPVKGAGVGTVKVGESGVSIPVIVRRSRAGGDPELMPTDVFHSEGRYAPLTPSAVKSAMQSREIGAPIKLPKDQLRGGNPYIGDLTGDASPLEFTHQPTPFSGPYQNKTAGAGGGVEFHKTPKVPDHPQYGRHVATVSLPGGAPIRVHKNMPPAEIKKILRTAGAPSEIHSQVLLMVKHAEIDKEGRLNIRSLPPSAKAAIMGAAGGATYRGYGSLRDIGQSSKKSQPLSAKEKAKMLAKGMGQGAVLGAAMGAVTQGAADAMGIQGPVRKVAGAAPSVRELCEEWDFDKTGSLKVARVSARKATEKLMETIRNNPTLRSAVAGGAAGGVIGGAQGALDGTGAARGAAKGTAIGAAGSALASAIHQKLGSADDGIEENGLVARLIKSGSMHPNDLANFRSLIASNPQVLQGAASTNLRLLDLILKHKGPSARPAAEQVTNPNIMTIAMDPLTMTLRVKFSGGAAETVTSNAELKTMLGSRYDEAMAAIRNHGVYVVADGVEQVTWDARRSSGSNAKPVERDGKYAIRDRNGGVIVGHVIMQMFQPNGMSVPMRLFVSHDGRYAVSTELYGIRLSGGPGSRLRPTAPARGHHGVFVTYVNGTPLSTIPLIIDSIGRLTSDIGDGVRDGDFVVYNVTNPINGEKLALVPSRSVQGFVRVRDIDPTKMQLTRGDIYMMPADVDWVRLTGRADVAKEPGQIVKVSQQTTDVLFHRGTGTFTVSRGGQSWQGSDIDTFELLASMGVTKEADLRDIVDQARSNDFDEPVMLTGLRDPKLVGHQVKVAEEKSFPVMEKLFEGIRPSADMLKAASLVDEQALDVMLGLNFITPQNVRLFTDSIDQFDEVASKLASLLLASRLGLQHVKEDAVKEAMEGIAQTGEYLRLLQSASQFKREQAQIA